MAEEREKPAGRPGRSPEYGTFARKVLIALSVSAAFFFLLFLLRAALQLLLLIFAGVLMATLVRSLSVPLVRRSGIPHPLAVLLVILAFGALSWLVGGSLSPRIAGQVGELEQQLPDALLALQHWIRRTPLGSELIAQIPDFGQLLRNKQVLQEIRSFFSVTLGVFSDLFIFFFVSLYLAFDPDVYIGGVLRLVPPAKRGRAAEVFAAMAATLRRWLLGTLISMASTGLITGIGLWLLGIPLALTLGLLAALLTFIPYLGGILSAVPAILLALLERPVLALYVSGVYLLAHTVEAYIVTPIVQQRQVHLPPVLTLIAQIVLGYTAGFRGLMLATPLVAVLVVLIKMLYIEDVLGESAELPGG